MLKLIFTVLLMVNSSVWANVGSNPVSRGYIVPSVEAAPNGVNIIVEIYHSKLNDKVKLELEARIGGGVVEVKRLNEQVKRNIERFPEIFRFSLNDHEKNELVANCDRFQSLKYSN